MSRFVFMDSFDHYCAANSQTSQAGINNLVQKWQSTGGVGASPFVTGVAGRRSGSSAVQWLTASTGNFSIQQTLPELTTVAIGVAMKWTNFGASNQGFLQIGNGRILPALAQNPDITFTIGADGSLGFYGGNFAGGALGGLTNPNVVCLNCWDFYEFTIVVNPSASLGSVTIKVNGNTWFTGNTQTDFSGSSTTVPPIPFDGFATTLTFNGGNAGMTFLIDDLYVNDTQTVGDRAVLVSFVKSAGTHQDWQPAPNGTTNYQNYGITSDKPCNDADTTFISSATPGNVETDFYETVSGLSKVEAVQFLALARKDAGGARQMSPVIRQGGIDYIAPTGYYPVPSPIGLGGNYIYERAIFGADPTGAIWTANQVNANEWGWKLIV